MPPVEEMDRNDEAVLWPLVGYSRRVEPVLGVPRQIYVRWVGKQSRTLTPTGNTIALDATVVVDEDIPMGSILWKGAIEDLIGTGSFTSPTDSLFQVKAVNSTDDLRGRFARRSCGLMRFSGRLPRVDPSFVSEGG